MAGEPYTFQDGSGELAAMAIGASLWGLGEPDSGKWRWHQNAARPRARSTTISPGMLNPDFPARARHRLEGEGLAGPHPGQSTGPAILRRDQRAITPTAMRTTNSTPTRPTTIAIMRVSSYNPTQYNFFNAAVAMNAARSRPTIAAGPIWAIFDADAVAREQWQVTPPYVDPDGYCFSANTLAELAAAINNPYQAKPMDGATLQATVERYNAFVDSGTDVDFGKPTPQYKIQTPPFYAAWATPLVHDTRAGLRINAQCQVMDMQGQVIPGLYCGGESAGGFNQHGLGRCTAQGYIAGKYAAAETTEE